MKFRVSVRLAGLFLLAGTAAAVAQVGNIRRFAGGGGPTVGDAVTNTTFASPRGIAVDASGNSYIVQPSTFQIFVVNSGVITQILGNGKAGYSGDGGPAGAAQLNSAGAVAVDSSGNIYIADTRNNVVRKVSAATGAISTFAGSYPGGGGYSGDGGAATSAQLSYPGGVAVDSGGNICIADSGNNVIRKVIAATGTISTIAGSYSLGYGYSGDGGPATSAQLNYPSSIALDSSANIYMVDSGNGVIRKVTAATGNIATVAGNYSLGSGYSGDGGAATSAQLNYPEGVAVDSGGNLYIADSGNHLIREVTAATGSITTFAGTYVPPNLSDNLRRPLAILRSHHGGSSPVGGYSGDGGAATSAQLNNPQGVAVDSGGNIYIADTNNRVIRKVTAATGTISTFAGNGSESYGGDGGAATSAQLLAPDGVATDSSCNVYISDQDNEVIRKVTAATGTITTIAGNYSLGHGYGGDGGAATSAQLSGPSSPVVDASGNLYIADSGNNVIRKVTASTGTITTVAGNHSLGGGYSGDGGAATSAQLFTPDGVAVDSSGTVYIADSNNNVVRKVAASTGTITTIAGIYSLPYGYSGDGGAATGAQLGIPLAIAVDSGGNIYIADYLNNVIRKITAATGTISTVAGNHALGAGYSGDGGPATSAQLNGPGGIKLDSAGNIYIADGSNNVVRKVAADTGIISTVAGNGLFGYSGDGGPATSAELARAGAVAVDSAGNIYIVDGNNNVVREVIGAAVTLQTSPAGLQVSVDGGSAQATPFTVGLTAGNHTISVVTTQTGTSGTQYAFSGWSDAGAASHTIVPGASPSTYTAAFTIIKANPTITWSAPAALAFGSALGSGQLNATASVPGTFVYTPPAGTVLPAGSNNLSVTFTPADSVHYNGASGSTTITINAAVSATPANLVVSRSLTRSGSNITAVITIANNGGTAAANVVLTTAAITGARTGTVTATPLPQSLGMIAAGGSAQATVTLPGSVGASGGVASISVGGSYTGSTFTSTARITLP